MTQQHYPTTLDIDLASTCNLRCSFCHMNYFDPKETKSLTYNDFLKIEHILPHIQKLTLFSKFEPLMCKDFIKIFNKIKEHKHLETYFSTNGVLLSEDIIDCITGSLTYLTVSITGFTKETYLKYMGKDYLDTVVKNIELLNRKKALSGTALPKLRISTVSMNDNIDELPFAIDLAAKLNAEEGIQLIPFISYHETTSHLIPKTNEDEYSRKIKNHKQYASSKNVKLTLQSGDFDENLKETLDLGHRECSLPWERISIQPNGDVYPCPVALESIGNFYEQDIVNIFNSEKMAIFRKRVNTAKDMNPECSRCIHCRHKSINDIRSNYYGDTDKLYTGMVRKG